MLIQWSRDADDLCIQLGGPRKISGHGKTGLLGPLDFRWGDAFDVAFATVQQFDLAGVNIKTGNPNAYLSKAQSQRQAYVAQTVDADVGYCAEVYLQGCIDCLSRA